MLTISIEYSVGWIRLGQTNVRPTIRLVSHYLRVLGHLSKCSWVLLTHEKVTSFDLHANVGKWLPQWIYNEIHSCISHVQIRSAYANTYQVSVSSRHSGKGEQSRVWECEGALQL